MVEEFPRRPRHDGSATRLLLNLGLIGAIAAAAIWFLPLRMNGGSGETAADDRSATSAGDQAPAMRAALNTPPVLMRNPPADAREEAGAQIAKLGAQPLESIEDAPPPTPQFELRVYAGAKNFAEAVGDHDMTGAPIAAAPETCPRPRSRESAAFKALLSNKKSGEHSLAERARAGSNPLLADLVEWRRLTDGGQLGWDRVISFIERRPAWPRMKQIRRLAELSMPEGYPREQALAFFADDTPQTARGARLFGEGLIAYGREEEGRRWIVEGWRARYATKSEEKLYLAKHAELIEPYHQQRLEMLIARGKYGAAKRQAARLGADQQALTEARVALLRSRRGVDGLIARVPEALRKHPGLVYARMVWGERRNRREEAEKSMRQASAADDLGDHPEVWADERLKFARDAYEKGRHRDAFELSARHGLTEGRDFVKLQWFAGWIALRQLNDPAAARERFETMWDAVQTPISRARAGYWAGHAARMEGDDLGAAEWFARAAAYPHAFYGQLAAETLEKQFELGAPQRLGVMSAGVWTNADADLREAAVLLYRVGSPRDARHFLARLAERRGAAEDVSEIASIARLYGDSTGEIVVGKVGEKRGQHVWTALYPAPAHPEWNDRESEPALLLGVARQESRFDIWARSHAGAQGLMQLMPATARWTARRLGLDYAKAQLTESPAYNLTLGDAHMRLLVDVYDGSYVLAIAAYNAGEGNVNKWLKRFGDPRDAHVDVVDWIESIPFNETRNYVQRVLEATQMYRARLAGRPLRIALSRDLSRGRRASALAAAGANAADVVAAARPEATTPVKTVIATDLPGLDAFAAPIVSAAPRESAPRQGNAPRETAE